MDRDFVYKQTLVWLEVEQDSLDVMVAKGMRRETARRREHLAESLTNHLVNNWEMVERARAKEVDNFIAGAAQLQQELTRDAPEYQDTGNSSLDI